MPSIDGLKNRWDKLIAHAKRIDINYQHPINGLFDPISVLAKLAMIPFMGKKTSILCLPHKIELMRQISSYSILSSSKLSQTSQDEDLKALIEPIQQAVSWYYDNPLSKKLFELAADGVYQLLNSQGKHRINKQPHLNKLYAYLNGCLEVESGKAEKSGFSQKEEFLKKMWAKEEIYAINRLLIKAQMVSSMKVRPYYNSQISQKEEISNILKNIEAIVNEKEIKLLDCLPN